LKKVGEIDKGIGASSAVAGGIKGFANNLGTAAKVAGLLALALVGRLGSALVETATKFIASEVAASRANIAALRLSAGLTPLQAVTVRAAAGARALGASLLSLAGGWVG